MSTTQNLMHGPEIIARTISATRIPDKFGNAWQYHSQSDRHSKATCWAILFDLLRNCSLLQQHVAAGKVGFGINHQMKDFQTNRKKDLDLVVCTPGSQALRRQNAGTAQDFTSLASQYGIALTSSERQLLKGLPRFNIVAVGAVHVALEAKAAMTEHVKALPRLHDELDSSHSTIHGNTDYAIAAALAMVNSAETFISPNKNKQSGALAQPVINSHNQPSATVRTIDKLKEIRRRSSLNQQGFDAIGIVVVDFKNDGSPCLVVNDSPAPDPSEIYHYDQMILRISSTYGSKFSSL